jgi:hypothetical protein
MLTPDELALALISAPFGAMKPRNIRQPEIEAVAFSIAALERDMVEPITTADRVVLGLIGQTLLLQRRAFRVATRGIERADGSVRPVVTEFRALSRLTLDAVRTLRFKDGTRPTATLASILAAHAGRQATNAEPDSPGPAHDVGRAAAGQDGDDGGQS